MKKLIIVIIISLGLMSCTSSEVKNDSMRSYSSKELNNIRRKVKVGDFENKTIYGEGRFVETMRDAIKSEANMSNKFEVLARDKSELSSTKNEIKFSNSMIKKSNQKLKRGLNIKEAEFALSGSLTEFSIEIFTKNTLTSQKKIQKTRAVVELKMMNLSTLSLQSFSGEATVDIKRGTTLGMGEGKSSYAQREEEAVRKAVIDAMNKAVVAMANSPWSTKGKLVNGKVYIPVGKQSNLKLGEKLSVTKIGEAFILDGEEISTEEKIGVVTVKNYLNKKEGSICEFTGEFTGDNNIEVIVREL